MRYNIRHTTRFTYSKPISESVTELRLQPRSEGNQQCLAFSVATTPPARIFAYRDALGNTVQHFDIPGRHGQLEIVSEALVEVDPPGWEREAGAGRRKVTDRGPFGLGLQGMLPDDAWERLGDDEVQSQHFDDLTPSRYALFTPLLQTLAAELLLPTDDDADPLTLALLINEGINQALDYVPQSTRVDSPIDEALANRKGVCQDFAHIMISLCRLRGLPARYVSGYLFHREQDADRSAQDASHAWVELWLPTMGWVGFDPTNNLLAGERHIRVAVGRDYADVPPVRGVFKGARQSTLEVAVQVSQTVLDAPDAVTSSVVWPPISSGELDQSWQQQEAQQQ